MDVISLLTNIQYKIIWNIVFQNLRKGRGRELTNAECLPCARHCARRCDIHCRVYCEYEMR